MYIYVAGPYSSDPEGNTEKACAVGDDLKAIGAIPFIPHLTIKWDAISPKPYEEWLDWDFKWLEKCDALIRFPGESPGAEREIVHARTKKIAIYHYPEDMDLLRDKLKEGTFA